jgi:pimeloyl-ACP methyl ester carboxylesterase
MNRPVPLVTTTWGHGPHRALLLHGLTSAATTWWRVGPAIAALGYTVTAPDLRGHGKSPAGDSLSIEAHRGDVGLLGDGWDLLVGHSLGGTIAAALVDANRDFTRSVIYEDPATDWDAASEFVMESPELVGLATAADIAAAHPAWHHNDVRYKVEALHSCRPDVEVRTVADVERRDIWSAMLKADLPSLVIAADTAVVSLVSEAQEAQAVGHSLQVVRIAGAGHSVHRDAPAEFMALVEGFVSASTGLIR